jgi:Ca2+-binding RTX toxin-like protein
MVEFNGANTSGGTAGTTQADVILSAGGNDTVNSGAGNDVVIAGTGNDVVNAGTGNDLVAGGAGNDTLSGGEGNDVILGGAGDDVISGGDGADIMSGGSGKDTFQIQANSGDDIIVDFQFGIDKLNFYANSFTSNVTNALNAKNISIVQFADLTKMIADHNMTVTNLGQDAAKIQIDADQSIVFLNVGKLFGFPADTNPNAGGTTGNDTVFGSLGNGQLVGGQGNDTVLGGSGASNISGDGGNVFLAQAGHNDLLVGGAGSDTMGGQEGNDTIFGNAGNDQISGGTGNDFLTGDDGADSFRFGTSFGHETVTDLNFAEGDRLVFLAGAIGASNVVIDTVVDLQIFAMNADSTHVDGGNLTITYGANSVTLLEYGELSF